MPKSGFVNRSWDISPRCTRVIEPSLAASLSARWKLCICHPAAGPPGGAARKRNVGASQKRFLEIFGQPAVFLWSLCKFQFRLGELPCSFKPPNECWTFYREPLTVKRVELACLSAGSVQSSHAEIRGWMRTVSIQLATMQLPDRPPFSSHSKALPLKSEKARFAVYTVLVWKTFLVKKKIVPLLPSHYVCLSKYMSFSSSNRITESLWLEGVSGDHPAQTPY